jgi:hypothetical protein
MPTTLTQTITRSKPSPLLAIEPKTETELLLIAALRESQEMNDSLANRNVALQASNLLNEMYCGNAKGALQTQEKKKEKKKGTGTLPDGLACVLTADEFYEARVNFEKGQRTEAKAKETRKDARAAWKEAKQEWQKDEDARLALKDREETIYAEQMAVWEAENARAQRGRGRGRGHGGGTIKPVAKPKKATIPKRVPPPLLRDFLAGNNEELGQEEGSNTGSASEKDAEGADEEEEEEQDE